VLVLMETFAGWNSPNSSKWFQHADEPKNRQLWWKKPRFRRWTVFAKT